MLGSTHSAARAGAHDSVFALRPAMSADQDINCGAPEGTTSADLAARIADVVLGTARHE